MLLDHLGWTPQLERQLHENVPGLVPGRVAAEFREAYRVLCADGECWARIEGKLRHDARSRLDFPAVGDWVGLTLSAHGTATIRAVLPRRNCVRRQAAGTAVEEQIVGANIDTMFLVSSLDRDFNPRRIERYIVLARDSQTRPVVVLNKADLCDDLQTRLDELEALVLGVPVHPISALREDGVDALEPYLGRGQTVAAVGSSGVGKSTLINALLHDEAMRTGDVRAGDGRGRHTTTHRQILTLPGGAMLLDTPGMRELQLWDAAQGVSTAFADIEALRRQCRFSDCAHRTEPGCAVRAALGATLDESRYANYQKLEHERQFQERKLDDRARIEDTQRWKAIHKQARERLRFKRRT